MRTNMMFNILAYRFDKGYSAPCVFESETVREELGSILVRVHVCCVAKTLHTKHTRTRTRTRTDADTDTDTDTDTQTHRHTYTQTHRHRHRHTNTDTQTQTQTQTHTNTH